MSVLPPAAPLQRVTLRTWLIALFVDHGVLRLLHRNWHRVGAQAFRSNHPLPHQVRAAARAGVRTIICLRRVKGARAPCALEMQACAEAGLAFVECGLNSRAAPRKEDIYRLNDMFAQVDYPVLLHCKSGADRAGLASALYLLLHEGRPVAEAQRQLALWPFGHVRQAKTGVLDFFLQRYAAYQREHGTAFLDWVRDVYDPKEVQRSFKENFWAQLIDRYLLRRE